MISKLIDKIVNTGAPIVVGLDPKLDFVPDAIKKRCFEEKGENLDGVAEAFWQFNKEIIDNIYDVVPAVKPQIAMYEEIGIPGLIAFKKTVDYCKEKGYPLWSLKYVDDCSDVMKEFIENLVRVITDSESMKNPSLLDATMNGYDMLKTDFGNLLLPQEDNFLSLSQ